MPVGTIRHDHIPDLTGIIAAIYDAPFLENGWQVALDSLHQVMPSVPLAIYGINKRTSTGLGQIVAGYDPVEIQRYSEHYASVNVWAKGFDQTPVGTVFFSESFIDRQEVFASEYYNDWLLPQENLVSGYGSMLVNTDEQFLLFSTTMRQKDEAELNASVAEVLDRLKGHVQRAYRLTGTMSAGWNRLLESVAGPAFALDAAGRVVGANDAAVAVADWGLFQDQGIRGGLRFRDGLAQGRFGALLTNAVLGRTGGGSDAFVARAGGGRRVACTLLPLAGGGVAGLPPLLQHFAAQPVAMLLTRMQGADQAGMLRLRFGLTDAEAAVALMIAEGSGPARIAAVRGTSLLTIRNQLRSIFDKSGVASQNELGAKIRELLT